MMDGWPVTQSLVISSASGSVNDVAHSPRRAAAAAPAARLICPSRPAFMVD